MAIPSDPDSGELIALAICLKTFSRREPAPELELISCSHVYKQGNSYILAGVVLLILTF
jgi:hypothetical protein